MGGILNINENRVQTPTRQSRPVGIIDQVRITTRKRHRIAAVTGAILGGFVPLATWTIAHYEAPARPYRFASAALS
jgi:hypothetical protein